jgi:hypothetical protein
MKEKPLHVKHSPSTEMVSTDEGTIRTSRQKARYKSPILMHQLLVFSAPARYRVAKIMRSSSKVVLQTTKHIVIYTGLGPSLEVIALHIVA